MSKQIRGVVLAALMALVVGAMAPSAAQNYPVKNIRLIAPLVAGRPTDAQARWAATSAGT